MNGFPGVGNVVTAQLAERLLAHQTLQLDPDVAAEFGVTYNETLEELNAAVPQEWGATTYFQHGCFGSADFYARLQDGEFIVVRDIRLNMYLNALVHSTHEQPGIETWGFHRSYGRVLLPVVRHPLDTIVSYASKLSSLGDAWLADVPAEFGRRNDVFARWAIRQPGALRMISHLLAAFTARMVKARHLAEPLRYEDCLSAPNLFVSNLAERLECKPSAAETAEIAGIIGNTSFQVGHLNRPSIGKWLDFFGPDELEIVRESGIWSVFSVLGYSEPTAASDFAHRADPEAAPREGASDLMRATALLLSGSFSYSELSQFVDEALLPARWLGEHLVMASDSARLDAFLGQFRQKETPPEPS